MSTSSDRLPHPPRTLVGGNIAAFAQDPLGFLTHCGQNYGDIVPLRFGLSKAYLIKRPEQIEQVLKEREIFVKNTPAWNALKTLVGTGLLTSEGDFWARQRRLSQPLFYQQRITAYGDIMVAYTDRLLQTWKASEVRDVHQDMTRLTLEIVTKTLLDLDMTGQEVQKIAHTLDLSMEWFASKRKQSFLLWMPSPVDRRYKQSLQELDQTIYQIIQQRRQTGEDRGDLLSLLLLVRDEDGSQMSDRQLRDEITTLISAGHETTAAALSWTWLLLSQHPEVEAKLLQELSQVLAGRLPTVADLPQLPYTQRVIKESMRLYPPVFSIARSATQNYDLDGYTIPAGSIALFCPWIMHRSPQYFDQPEQFQPDRWATDLEKQLPKCVYFPFGEGPRICIGKSFAQMEAALILATIASRYQLRLVPNHSIEPLPSITLRPKYGLKMQLQQR